MVFPIAFYSGALVFDLAGYFGKKHALHALAYFLCWGGSVMAFLAAIPGVVDYVRIVPPRSSAKKRATFHALLNCMVLIIFSVVIFLRMEGFEPWFLIPELIAVIMMIVAGWHGGTLVHRNQIGIDHRYAWAGKWNEARLKGDPPFEVLKSGELKEDQMKLIHVDGDRVVLASTKNGFAAFDDRCPHRGGPLSDGTCMGGQVQCPWHGSQFDVHTGKCLKGPATSPIGIHDVNERDGKVVLTKINKLH